MITSQDKELIVRLIANYAGNMTTDRMLESIADNNGMLSVCQLLVQKNNADDREVMSWVDGQCYKKQVDLRSFLYEVQQILLLFQPGQENDEHYFTLGLEVGASGKEIKDAYRELCRRYHPDTATSSNASDSTTFIEINKAYNTLRNTNEGEQEHVVPSTPTTNWSQESRTSSESAAKKKRNIFWFSSLTFAMVVVSILAARGYQQKAMITGLQLHQAAFIPPNSGGEKEIEVIEEIVSKDKPTSVVEETKIVEAVEVEEISNMDLPPKEAIQIKEKQPRKISQVSFTETVESSPEIIADKDLSEQSIKIEEKESTPVLSGPVKKTMDKPEIVVVAKEIKKSKKVVNTGMAKELPVSVSVPPVKIEKQAPTPEEVQADMQIRIENFLRDYTAAYKNKDLETFSNFFSENATENGKSINQVLPTYIELFSTASEINLDISILKWLENQSNIELDGRFAIRIDYKDGKKVKGNGSISFLLRDSQPEFLIKEMTYQFDE